MTTTRGRLTDSEREARRAEQRELVTAAIKQLRSSEGWQAYLRGRRYFRAYSARNVLMILQQHPTAERVAGFRAWLALGYCPVKGSRAIRIWAPCPPSKTVLQKWRETGADPETRPRTGWRLACMFDRLSRVRSGECHRRRVGRYVVGWSPEPALLVRPSATAEWKAMVGAAVAEVAPGGRRAAAIARASPVPLGTEAR